MHHCQSRRQHTLLSEGEGHAAQGCEAADAGAEQAEQGPQLDQVAGATLAELISQQAHRIQAAALLRCQPAQPFTEHHGPDQEHRACQQHSLPEGLRNRPLGLQGFRTECGSALEADEAQHSRHQPAAQLGDGVACRIEGRQICTHAAVLQHLQAKAENDQHRDGLGDQHGAGGEAYIAPCQLQAEQPPQQHAEARCQWQAQMQQQAIEIEAQEGQAGHQGGAIPQEEDPAAELPQAPAEAELHIAGDAIGPWVLMLKQHQGFAHQQDHDEGCRIAEGRAVASSCGHLRNVDHRGQR